MSDTPRTLRRRERVSIEDLDDDETTTTTTTDDDDDDDDDEATETKAKFKSPKDAEASKDLYEKLHGGWTDGQKVMDSTSSFIQTFRPEDAVQFIKFLDNNPYANYRRHWIDRINAQGKAVSLPFMCLQSVQKECPLCKIADKPQAVSAFNVAIIGDDDQLLLRSWDVGVKLFNVLKAYNNDAKVGPLTKRYYAVNKTGKGGSGGQVQTNVSPISKTALLEDYSIEPPDDEALDALVKYTITDLEIPKASKLEEMAQELVDLD